MEVTEEIKFKRYLNYGSEHGVYVPGCRFYLQHYTPEKLTSLKPLLDAGKEDEVIEMIQTAYKNKTSVYPDSIVFVLAHCTRDNCTKSLKERAYKLVERICTSTEDLFIFFKFSFEVDPRRGSGRASRRLVKNWYLNKSALELAEVIAMKPKYKGWRHSDLIKLAHVKTTDPGKGAVLRYAVKGLDKAKEQYAGQAETDSVLAYLAEVRKFRHSVNPADIVQTIESYMLTFDHLNYSMLKNKEIWTALLRLMPLAELLDHFQFLSKNKMFRNDRAWDSDFINAVCDALENPAKLAESGLHPARIYLELCAYQNIARIKLELGSKSPNGVLKTPPTLSSRLIASLDKVFRSSMKYLKPTGLRYMVGIDVPLLKEKHCGYCRYVDCDNAAAVITLCLLQVEKHIDVVTSKFDDPNILFPVNVPPGTSVAEFCTIINNAQGSTVTETKVVPDEKADSHEQQPQQPQERPMGSTNLHSMFSWAKNRNKEVDVFIYLSTFQRHPPKYLQAFRRYKETRRVPNARLVICDLAGTLDKTAAGAPDMLIISGFDSKVCRVIDSFTKGAF